ncbi:alpha/beta fold hydrolase [Microbacterium sp.]|uniref:alpha/beta fold hydrolase n=1 Tax=Microbacterium sp. TaxID=51671 RepID=UPI003A85E44B
MPTITTTSEPAVRLHYTDSGGDGAPVVLIHGWPLSGAAFDANLAALTSAGYRAITYDRRGFGQSDKAASGYDYDRLAADLHDLVTTLDLRGAVLLGFSMGGGEVARYCGTFGTGRLAGVVLSGSICPALCITDDNPDGAMPMSGFEDIAASVRQDHDGFVAQFVTWFFSNDDGLAVTEEQRDAAVQLALQSDTEAAARTALAWATDLRDDCRAIDVPTLVLHGTGDQNVPLAASSARVGQFVPDATLVTIGGGTHGVNLSHRSEWEGALLTYLDGLGR